MREVALRALEHAAEHGLPGEHHFYLTFRTDAPGVSVPGHLKARYPQEMTIVLQHQFWDLKVDRDAKRVSVGLSFGGTPSMLVVPFSALVAFLGPPGAARPALRPARGDGRGSRARGLAARAHRAGRAPAARRPGPGGQPGRLPPPPRRHAGLSRRGARSPCGTPGARGPGAAPRLSDTRRAPARPSFASTIAAPPDGAPRPAAVEPTPTVPPPCGGFPDEPSPGQAHTRRRARPQRGRRGDAGQQRTKGF